MSIERWLDIPTVVDGDAPAHSERTHEHSESLLYLVPDPAPLPDAVAVRDEAAEIVRDAMDRALSDRERTIIAARFGFGEDDTEQTLDEIGQQLGLSRERVRQIARDARMKLHTFIAARMRIKVEPIQWRCSKCRKLWSGKSYRTTCKECHNATLAARYAKRAAVARGMA